MLTHTEVFEMVVDSLIEFGPPDFRSKSRAELMKELQENIDQATTDGDGDMVNMFIGMFTKAYEEGRKSNALNAERYEYLREQNWHDSKFFVVYGGKDVVQLGTHCPSRDQLDELIDNAKVSE